MLDYDGLKEALLNHLNAILSEGRHPELLKIISYEDFCTWFQHFHLFNEGGLKTIFFHVGKDFLSDFFKISPSEAVRLIEFDTKVKGEAVKPRDKDEHYFKPDVSYYNPHNKEQPIVLIEVCQTWEDLRKKLEKYAKATYSDPRPLLVFAGLGFTNTGCKKTVQRWGMSERLLREDGALIPFKEELRRCLNLYGEMDEKPVLLMGLTFIFWWYYNEKSKQVMLRPLKHPLWQGFNENLLRELPQSLSIGDS